MHSNGPHPTSKGEIDTKMNALHNENILGMNCGKLIKENLVQKLKYNFSSTSPICTNSPALACHCDSLQILRQWGMMLNIPPKKFQKNLCNMEGLSLWV